MSDAFISCKLAESPGTRSRDRVFRPRKLVLSMGTIFFLWFCPSLLGNSVFYFTADIAVNFFFKQTIGDLRNAHTDLDEVTITPTGEWVIIAGNKVFASPGFPAAALTPIQNFIAEGQPIHAVAFSEQGGVVVSEDEYVIWGMVPDHNLFVTTLEAWLAGGRKIDEVAFSRNNTGFVLISGVSAFYSNNLPEDLKDALYDRRFSKRRISHVQFGDNDRWVVIADQFFASSGISSHMYKNLVRFQKGAKALENVALGPGDSYVIYGGTFTPNNLIEAIEYGFEGGTKNIYERMEDFDTPGVTLAIIENNQVIYARGYGVLEAGTQRAVLAKKRFPAASLSKMVGGILAAKLIEQGYFDYDSDILDFSEPANALGIWQTIVLNDPAGLGVIDTPLPAGITVSRLLSHTAGMVPSSSTQISNWPPWDPATFYWLIGMECDGAICTYGNGRTVWYNPAFGPPGSEWNYSGGGFVVMEALAEVTTGINFEDFSQNQLFTPMGLVDSTFASPIPANWESDTTKNHDDNGNPIPRRHYPWHTAGGLHTSAKDYAKLMILLLNEGRTDIGQYMLSESSVNEILADRVVGSGSYGLGIALSDSVVNEDGGSFGHSGSQPGAKSAMVGFPSLDQGIVVMVNGDRGLALATEIRSLYQCVYSLPTCP